MDFAKRVHAPVLLYYFSLVSRVSCHCIIDTMVQFVRTLLFTYCAAKMKEWYFSADEWYVLRRNLII